VRDAFVRMKHRAIAKMFVRLSESGMDVYCDHTVHVGADLSLWLDSPMFWAFWHQSMSTYLGLVVFFRFHLEERWGMDEIN